jgi:DNA polymerase-1
MNDAAHHAFDGSSETTASGHAVAGLCDIAPSQFARFADDAYFTIDAPWIVPSLYRTIRIEGPIYEPCAGRGHLVVELRKLGFEVAAADLHPHADPLIPDIATGVDIFNLKSLAGYRFAITNLPYKEQDAILAHLLPIAARDGCAVAVLARSEWSSAVARRALIHGNPHFAGEVRLTKRPEWVRPAIASPRHWFSWFMWSGQPRAEGQPPFLWFAGATAEPPPRPHSQPPAQPLPPSIEPSDRGDIVDSPGAAPADFPAAVYCVTPERAETLVREMLRDAAGRPLACDIETAATQAAAERLQALELRQATLKGTRKAAKRAKAPAAEIAALEGELKLEAARIKYAKTAALDPHRARIRLLQLFGGGHRIAVIDLFRTGIGVLELLAGVDIVAHNAAFELAHLEAAGIELGQVFCTMQAARLTLGERAMSLASAVNAHLGIELDKREQRSDWAAPQLSRAQLDYAAHDAVVTFRLAARIFPALERQIPAYEVQAAVTPAVARMQRRGILLDLDVHARLMRALEAERAEKCEEYKAAWASMGLPAISAVPKTPNQIREALSAILSSSELAKWQRTVKTGAISTARADLRRAAHYPPIVPLVRVTRIDKLLSTFGPTLAALINPVTGRVHASYRVAATASGRASCSYPNLQQVPSKKSSKEFRTIFIAQTGYKIVAGDFATMELRAAGYIANDSRMIDAFRAGVDLHKLTASQMQKKPIEEVTDEERSHAKPINFGAIYGEGARGLVASAWKDYELVLTEREAREWLDVFSETYPDFARWRRLHCMQCETAGCIIIGKDAAKGLGRIYPLSRLPPYAGPYTRSCNLPIQGACADASMLALTAIDQALFDAGIDGGPIAWIHDEILLEISEADAERAKQLLETAMTDAFEETFPGSREMGLLRGLVEASIGDNWAAVKH